MRSGSYAQAIADVDGGRRVLACPDCYLVRPWRGAADAERDGWTRESLRAPWRCPICSAPNVETGHPVAAAADPYAWLLAAARRDSYGVRRALEPMADRDRARFVELVDVVLAAWPPTSKNRPPRTRGCGRMRTRPSE